MRGSSESHAKEARHRLENRDEDSEIQFRQPVSFFCSSALDLSIPCCCSKMDCHLSLLPSAPFRAPFRAPLRNKSCYGIIILYQLWRSVGSVGGIHTGTEGLCQISSINNTMQKRENRFWVFPKEPSKSSRDVHVCCNRAESVQYNHHYCSLMSADSS